MVPPAAGHPHLCCPFCQAYEVDRLFLASQRLDACECRACGQGWEEERLARVRSRRALTQPKR